MIKKIGLSIMAVLLVVVGTVYATIAVYAALNANVKNGGISIQYAATDDLWNNASKTFYKANVNKLLQKLSGDSTASTQNMAKIDQMATAENDFNIPGSDSDDFREKDYDKHIYENIVVTLGGFTWYACYLSKDKQNNTILTLWLTGNSQKPFEDMQEEVKDFYSFKDGCLYGSWSSGWIEQGNLMSSAYPSNMYGTSYISAVTLNNGGNYAVVDYLRNFVKTEQSVFALFTMENLSLTDYIVKPKDVSWQENGEFAKNVLGERENYANENWQKNLYIGDDDLAYLFSLREGFDAWSDGYLWLPSFSETGYGNSSGLWQTDTHQHYNYGYQYAWLRSSYISGNSGGCKTTQGYIGTVTDSYAVRPALHLNLTAAAKALNV